PTRSDPADRGGGKGTGDEHWVGGRLERRPEGRRAAAAPRGGAAHRIGRGRHKEDGQRGGGVADRDEADHRDDQKGACRGQRVRERHCATKTRSTTSPCLPSPAISWPL